MDPDVALEEDGGSHDEILAFISGYGSTNTDADVSGIIDDYLEMSEPANMTAPYNSHLDSHQDGTFSWLEGVDPAALDVMMNAGGAYNIILNSIGCC